MSRLIKQEIKILIRNVNCMRTTILVGNSYGKMNSYCLSEKIKSNKQIQSGLVKWKESKAQSQKV